MLNQDRYECRPCKQGPSIRLLWPIRLTNRLFGGIYCDRCGRAPTLVAEPEVVQTVWGRVEVPAERDAVA